VSVLFMCLFYGLYVSMVLLRKYSVNKLVGVLMCVSVNKYFYLLLQRVFLLLLLCRFYLYD